MDKDTEAEVYKITAIDDKGNEIVAYVKSEMKALYVRDVSSEYGKLTIVPMMMDELPEDVKFNS